MEAAAVTGGRSARTAGLTEADRDLPARAGHPLRRLGGLQGTVAGDRLGVAVRRERHDDAAPVFDRRGLLAADDDRRAASRPLAVRRGALHDEGGDRRDSCSARSSASRLRCCSRTSRCSSAACCPYVVGSQTVPILAIAPMVVIGLGSKGVQGWQSVAVIAAYLTFFPVAINTLRGLKSPDPRAVELMQSYAAGRWEDPLAPPCPILAAVHLHRAQDLCDRERDRGDHRRDPGLDPGRARRGDRELQPVLLAAADLPVGDERRLRAARARVLRSRRPRRAPRRPACSGAPRMSSERAESRVDSGRVQGVPARARPRSSTSTSRSSPASSCR